MLAALVFMLWMWDRVLTNCRGEAESASYYYFQATVRLNATATCLDEQGNPYACTMVVPGASIRFTADIPDPGIGTTVTTTYDPVMFPDVLLPVPPVGGMTAWPWPTAEGYPVVAVDPAGNKSGEACP